VLTHPANEIVCGGLRGLEILERSWHPPKRSRWFVPGRRFVLAGVLLDDLCDEVFSVLPSPACYDHSANPRHTWCPTASQLIVTLLPAETSRVEPLHELG